jgi:pimeloyl-ACP methyl ester carboxylesterase
MKTLRWTILLCAVSLTAPAGAAAGTLLSRCKDAKSAQCGTVMVPLERSDPVLGSIPIFFRVMRHTGSGPAQEPIFTTEGGPGYSVTQNNWQAYAGYVFAPLRTKHDLVFIDQRGVGLSDAIDCSSVQNGVSGDLYSAFAQCAAHLGATANDYGSGDVALDIDAVRAALGVDKFDFYGGSNAAADIQAYAARFGQHLDAVVLDSPVKLVGLDDLGRSTPAAMEGAVKLICRRSASCSRDHVNAGGDFAWLAKRLRRHPLVGVGTDSAGRRHHLRVSEAFLAWRIMANTDGPFVAYSEIPAAAAALKAGDDVPLLRIAADSAGPLIGVESVVVV